MPNKEQVIDELWGNAAHGTRREDIEAAYAAGEAAATACPETTASRRHQTMTQQHVKVSFSKMEIAKFYNEVHAGVHMVSKLKGSGVAVEGSLFPMGVSSGVLQREDSASGEIVFTWTQAADSDDLF